MVTLICPECGTSFERRAVEMRRRKKPPCCSARCSRLHYSGERHPEFRGARHLHRGAGWQRRAAIVRVRDGNICRLCGKTATDNRQALSVDHIIPWRSFADKDEANAEANLVSLCRSCHTKKTVVAEAKWLRGDALDFMRYVAQLGAAPPTEEQRLRAREALAAITRAPRVWLRGETHGSAKLTARQVGQIRASLALGVTTVALGHQFGVSNQTISAIKTGATWKP